MHLALVVIGIVLVIYAMRLGLTRLIVRDASYSLRDAAITSMMAPKGLVSAVLATLPLEYGIAGGAIIRDAAYMVVLVSITLTALMVIAYPFPVTQKIYARVLGRPLPVEKEH